ncbi:shikimate dehydrogenase [Oxalobacteraceae bacterium GrIS 2.11]
MPNKTAPAVDQYAVLGNPITHSQSPFLHTVFAAQTGQHLQYRAMLVELDQFEAKLRQFIEEGASGANITVPFKIDAYDICDELTPRAAAAAAVNTMTFVDGQIIGDNTDGYGLVRDIVINAEVELQGKRILLLGAGGAARGVILPLLECHPAEFTIANRNSDKARQLANEFKQYGKIITSEFSALKTGYDVIINATSSSLAAERPDIPDAAFKANTLAYDMMYASHPTPFMEHAAAHHAVARDGWGMLVEQAAEAFFVWRGVRPDTDNLLAKVHLHGNQQ